MHPFPIHSSGSLSRIQRRLPVLRPRLLPPLSWACLALLTAPFALAAPPDSPESQEPPAVERLIQSLESTDFYERQRALDGLSAWRASAASHAPALREHLRDTDQKKRQHAAMALAGLGVGEPSVIDELLAGMARLMRNRYLDQPDPAYSSQAALVALGPAAVPALIKAMEDKAYPSQELAVEALGKIGSGAKEAVPALVRRLDSEDIASRCRAVEAKWRIDGDADFARTRLVPLLEVKAGRECNGAVYTLAVLGADAEPAMPAILQALERHPDPGLLQCVADLAPHAKEWALPALREALNHPLLADAAAIHLQNLGEPSGPLIAHQLRRLKQCTPNDGSDPMRIVYTVVIHGPEAKGAYSELAALLNHDTPAVRQAAAWGLPRIFAEEAPVIAALTTALQDPAAAEEAARSLKMLEAARQ